MHTHVEAKREIVENFMIHEEVRLGCAMSQGLFTLFIGVVREIKAVISMLEQNCMWTTLTGS